MARQIRTRSGRLRASERRRRVKAANPKPGEVVILDVSRRRSKGKRGGANSMGVELFVDAQFAVDIDVRKLIHAQRIALAQHFTDALKAGQRADGRGPLPQLSEKTVAQDPGRNPDTFGRETGEMARRWLLGKITGTFIKASTRIKPWGGDGRSFMINRLLGRGIDFQSVKGAAAEVLKAATEVWIRQAFPSSGDGVATPRTVPRNAGELNKFNG